MLLILLTIVLFVALAQSFLFVSELVYGVTNYISKRAWILAALWAVFYLLTKLA